MTKKPTPKPKSNSKSKPKSKPTKPLPKPDPKLKKKSSSRSGGIDLNASGDVDIKGDVVGGDKTVVVQEPLRPIVQALHQLPPPIADFVGRGPEIAELKQQLHEGRNVVVICGMGGAGKTELALKVANDLRVDFPDTQLFVELHGSDITPRNSADVLTACIRAYIGQEAKLPETMEELAAVYRSNLNGKRTLILLDDAADEAQVQPLLPPTGCVLLITSRSNLMLQSTIRIALNEFPSDEARQLLVSLAPRTARRLPIPITGVSRVEAQALLARRKRPEVADQICYLCGDLPLAIRAAGSLLNVNRALDPVEYVKQLRSDRTRLGRIGMVGNNLSVEACFGSSYMRLPLEAARVFRFLAVFPAWFDAGIEEIVCEDEAQTQLNNLIQHSLIECNPDNGRYRLHDLVRMFIAKRISSDERKIAAKHIVKSLKDKPSQYERAMFFGECLLEPHWSLKNIRTTVLKTLCGLMVDELLAQADRRKRRKVARLLTRLRWLDEPWVSPDQMIVYLELIARYVYLPDECHYLLQHVTSMLKSTSVSLSKLQEAQLLIYRAVMLVQLGELDEAQRDYEDARLLTTEIIGSESGRSEDYIAAARVNLGAGVIAVSRIEMLTEQKDKQQRQQLLNQAEKSYQAAAELAEVYKSDIVLMAYIYVDFDHMYVLLPNWDRAKEYYRRAFQILERIKEQDPEEYVWHYAEVLEAASDTHLQRGYSLTGDPHLPNDQNAATEQDILLATVEYETAYRYAWTEICLLKKHLDEMLYKNLSYAHMNAGDSLWAMNRYSNYRVRRPAAKARLHWRIALKLAQRLGISDVAQATQERLEQSNPDRIDPPTAHLA